FVSASIHRSMDGVKVINYAQWQSEADFAAMRENPQAQRHMQSVAALARFEPIVCEVVESISANR
ncbi:MAG: antibiotic biosynthesis monooxygenase, partial [bacterium]